MDESRRPIGLALSPAKLNLSLHILGRRADGFHSIDSVMQTISLFDRVTMLPSGSGLVASDDPELDGEDNLIGRAAREFSRRCGRAVDVDFYLEKRIPVAAGMGGGSSNAAAAIRLLARHWGIPADDAVLHDAATATGSDVPFFLHGGKAHVTGRGELIEPTPPGVTSWYVVVVPPIAIERKTARLYAALTPEDYSNSTEATNVLHNAFERPLYDNFSDVEHVARAFRSLTDVPVGLSGAGPAHFAGMPDAHSACELLRKAGQYDQLGGCRCHLARSMNGPAPLRYSRNESDT